MNQVTGKILLACITFVLTLLLAAPVPAHDFGGYTWAPGDNPPKDADGNPHPGDDGEPGNDPDPNDPKVPDYPEDPEEQLMCDDEGDEGDPVMLYDGRYDLAVTDMVVNGLFPIEISRRYDSRSFYDSSLGFGWSFGFDRRLYEFPDGSVIIRYACGSRDRFVFSGGAFVTPVNGRQGTLKQNPNGSYIYSRRYGTKEFYDAQGRLTAVQDGLGHRHEYTYDPAGKYPLTGTSNYALDPTAPMTVAYVYRLTRIDERAADGVLTGNFVTFSYDTTTGRVTSVTSSDGRTVGYVHDTTAGLTAGNLVNVNGLEGVSATYQYNDANDSHNLTSFQEETGATPWVSSYDTSDRVILQTHGNDTYTYDYVVDLTETSVTHTISDASGLNPYDVTSTYYFDAGGDVALKRDAEGNETQYVRDAWGNMIEKRFYENQGTVATPSLVLQRTIEFEYDAYGRNNSTSVTLDSGEVIATSRNWDNGWLVYDETVSSLDPAKVFRTVYTYYRDGQGSPTNVESVSYRNDDGSFDVFGFAYDAKNRPIEITFPDGQKIVNQYQGGSLYITKQYYEVSGAESPYNRMEFAYDAQGNRNLVTDARGYQTQLTYDDRGRITQIVNALNETNNYSYTGLRLMQFELGYTTSAGEGQLRRVNYHADGWLQSIEEKDGLGVWQTVITNTHDSAGNLLSSADAQARTVTHQYDLLGRVSSMSDPLGKTIDYGYDMFGNMTSITEANSSEVLYTYDDYDRVVQVEQTGASTPAAITTLTYDALGNLLSVTDPENNTTTYTVDNHSRITAVTQPLGQTLQWTFDSSGRMDYLVNARGHKIDYDYDPWGTVSTKRYYASTSASSPDRTVTFTYDHNLNLASVSDDAIQAAPLYTYTWDELDRLDVETVAYIPGGSRTLDYSYDRYGNIDGVDYVDGSTLSHDYTYDKRNRLTSATLPGSQGFAFNYYAAGDLQQASYPNGITTDYVYEDNGPIQSITVAGTSGTIEQFAYTYDDVANVDTQTDADGLHDYTYDDFSRLTQAVHPGATGLATENYTYDRVGNREDPSNAALYDYDGNNRITQSPGLSYTFDDDGNMTGSGASVSIKYDKEQRISQYDDGSVVTDYQYDPFGRRISKTVGGQTTWFLWEDNMLLSEYDGAGARIKRYAYLPYGFSPAQVEDANGIYNVHDEDYGTPRILTDGSGDVVWRSLKDSFGKATVDADPDGDGNAIVFNHRFPGQYHDEETGLHYNYLRYYDPETGRYITRDPIGLAGGVNPYIYANANPLSLIDPSGLVPGNSKIRIKTDDPYAYAILLTAYFELISTKPGRELCEEISKLPEPITIIPIDKDAYYCEASEEEGCHPYYPVIRIDPYHNRFFPTTEGYQMGTTAATMGHELGHHLDSKDDGPGKMNNVNRWENPIREALGLAARLYYGNPFPDLHTPKPVAEPPRFPYPASPWVESTR